MSTFGSISTALSSLYAQRRGMDITGQNIANANTDGYSRQRADMVSVGAPTTPSLHATYNEAGGGVAVKDLTRLRDVFLEQRARLEHSNGAYLDQRKASLDNIELVTGKLGDTGLQTQLSDLWASFHDIANRPDDKAARSQLLQRAGTLMNTLNDQSSALSAQWSAQREQTDAIVAEINTAANTVANLNQAILRATAADLPSNELKDQRDQLAQRLCEMTGATVRPSPDGSSIDVYLGGSTLVRGSATEAVRATGALDISTVGGNPVSLVWADGRPADVPGGKLAAVFENLDITLPAFSGALDNVAATLITTVNTQHAAGFDLAGNAGGPLFSGNSASTVAVMITDPTLIAASSIQIAGGNRDGGNADLLAGLATSPTGPDAAYRTLMVDLGVAVQAATRRSDIQSNVTAAADGARESISGVNMDEEMTNMLQYQRAYEGAARVLTAIDAALDTLINRTGLVGR